MLQVSYPFALAAMDDLSATRQALAVDADNVLAQCAMLMITTVPQALAAKVRHTQVGAAVGDRRTARLKLWR